MSQQSNGPGDPDATLTEQLAQFMLRTGHDDVPLGVRKMTALLALDAIGIAIANRREPFVAALVEVVGRTTAPGLATVIGSSTRLVAEGAAEANSGAMHGSDLDATHIGSIIHPTAIGIPVGLAVGEVAGASGREVLAAMACGMEALVRLGLGAQGAYHLRGYQATALLGPVVAAMMAARLHGREDTTATEAAGLATAIAAGLRSFSDDGTWGKRLITGWACRAGIHAEALVAAGFRGSHDALEKRWGLFPAFLPDGGFELDRVTSGLGEIWTLLDTEPKRYPCSHGLHPFIESALSARDGLDPVAIARIECSVNAEAARWWFEPPDARYRPDPYSGRFSIPYTVARAFLDGTVDDATFSEDAVRETPALALTARVRPILDPDLEEQAPVGLPGGLHVTMADGSVIDVPIAPHPTDADGFVVRRFRATVGDILGTEAAGRLETAILGLADAPSVRGLLDATADD